MVRWGKVGVRVRVRGCGLVDASCLFQVLTQKKQQVCVRVCVCEDEVHL